MQPGLGGDYWTAKYNQNTRCHSEVMAADGVPALLLKRDPNCYAHKFQQLFINPH